MTHLAESASLSKKGHVQLSNSVTSTSNALAATPSAVKTAMDRADAAFTSASNGKVVVGNAITGVDENVVIPTEPTFNDLASAIGQISTGKKWASEKRTTFGNITVSGLPFRPSVVILKKGDISGTEFNVIPCEEHMYSEALKINHGQYDTGFEFYGTGMSMTIYDDGFFLQFRTLTTSRLTSFVAFE